MKLHSIPAPPTHTAHGEGAVKYPPGFNWKTQCLKALEKQKYRAIHLARTNPDYQIKYPNECRSNPENKVLLCCHPEAEKRILKEHEKILMRALVPDVDRPKRMNRIG